jgi:lipopolysaccharide/colanic/teichoic acid biosynthesis glycosyltransferase
VLVVLLPLLMQSPRAALRTNQNRNERFPPRNGATDQGRQLAQKWQRHTERERVMEDRLSISVLDRNRSSNGHVGNGANGTKAPTSNGHIAPVNARNGLTKKALAKDVIRVPRWKRILDVACVGLTAPVWLSLMLMVMTLIRMTSRGPIFYRQERVGYRRRHFMLFKFRTMHVNAETRTHEEYFAELMQNGAPMKKLDESGDCRLIPGGRLLRASGLDELPQIFNVLRGEMSLVGPRPCLPQEFDRYESWQQQRVNAVPGLTGYWQVNGKNETTFREMIALDLFYIKNMSLWLDLRIIFKTIPTLLSEILRCRRRSRRELVSVGMVDEGRLAQTTTGMIQKT